MGLVLTVCSMVTPGELIEAKGGEDIKRTQLALYRLHQLGAILGYSLQYKSLCKVQFEVTPNADFNRDVAKENVSAFLAKTRASIDAIASAMQAMNRIRVRTGESKHAGLVESAARVLLERVYAEVPKMRYDMLTNELRYAHSHHYGQCRRLFIRNVFEDYALEDYKCGFCDVCVPTLEFQRTSAEVPTRDAQMDDIVANLDDILADFDTDEMPDVVDVVVAKGGTRGMFFKMASVLERDATNVSAMYMAGALGRRVPEFKDAAFRHLRDGYSEMRRQGKDEGALVLTYEEAKHLDAHEAFTWVEEQGGPFDRPYGMRFLQNEADVTFGEHDERSRNLLSLTGTRELSKMTDDVKALGAGVNALGDALKNMPTLEV